MKELTPITRKEKILNGEDLEPITRLEYFLQKAIGEGGSGSGGSSLPPYTTSDIGKSLTVVQGTETVVVVPEQTVTSDANGEAALVDVDFSRLTDGQEVALTLSAEGQSESSNVTYINGALYFDPDGSGDPFITNEWCYFQPSSTLTLSATASVPSAPSVAWESGGGAKPVEVFVDERNTPTEINMNAAELYSMLRNGSVRFEYTPDGMDGSYVLLQLYSYGSFGGAYQFILAMDDYNSADPVKYEFSAMSGNEHPVADSSE